MKKILLAVDGANYSKCAMEFAKSLNEKSSIVQEKALGQPILYL
jgi:hypothetical protein